ncbi:GyrI-like domain-containing protein [Ruania suaedae]|uniref:GyrI-like domain-containing protein n=1 Tax=Ruania suaedae TaxID=2897774 RepID=UPI001E38B421|nr:GyrI-like domain-containing protein [Ruania suaedae]UFU04322.1 GyrI-like domain-containing protein [Ruania suaedae]
MKIDLKTTIPSYTAHHGRFSLLEVPPLQYLAIDGQGDPNTSPDYAGAVGSLYPLAYALKFLSKDELGRDYVVMPLEALWWAEDMSDFTTHRDKSRWRWTVMILVPDWLGNEHVEAARETVRRKGGAPALAEVRLAALEEGLSVQTLHIGPYDAEGPVLARMHTEFIPAQGLQLRGRHHEIYLGDPRRVPAERLRTVLRQPVERAPR